MSSIQVCSSAFVNSTWTTYLYGFGSTARPYLQLDRPLLSKQHQIIGRFCAISQRIVNREMSNFYQTRLTTSLTLSRDLFVSQISRVISQFFEAIFLHFGRNLQLLLEMIAANYFPSAFNTDWLIEYGNAANGYLVRNIPYLYDNGTCNCAVSNACQKPLRIGPPDLVIKGLVVGCLPMHGLRMSTLECFYSSDCVKTVLSYLDYYMSIDGSPPLNFTIPKEVPIPIASLNASIASRFLPNTSVGTLINEVLVEQWNNRSSYEDYFNICAPTMCRYEYMQRRDALFIITSLLGLYGGLAISLRFIAWNTMELYYKILSLSPDIRIKPQPSIVPQ